MPECVIRPNRVNEIISSVKISAVYTGLTGVKARRSGQGRFRGPATWRGGDGHSVALDDGKGVWHDFASGDGGGMLALVDRARGGGNKSDALRWLADFTGILLEDTPLTRHERSKFAQERADFACDLKAARYWRQSAEQLCEQVLIEEKARLFDPTEGEPNFDQLRESEALLDFLRRAGDAALVSKYRDWLISAPTMTAGMVWAAQRQEERYRAALLRFLDQGGDGNARP